MLSFIFNQLVKEVEYENMFCSLIGWTSRTNDDVISNDEKI
ncbi:hypothetical protein bcgnr5379_20460 [Bacillus cereus]